MNMENHGYVEYVRYGYMKWNELNYSVVLEGDLLECEKKFRFEFDSISFFDKSCMVYFLCKNTEDFVYQAIHKLIFVVNNWKYTEKLEESDYKNVKKYIISLLESNDFANKNRIEKKDEFSWYEDKLRVFSDLLNILDEESIESKSFLSFLHNKNRIG